MFNAAVDSLQHIFCLTFLYVATTSRSLSAPAGLCHCVPVIGVVKAGWNVDQLKDRAKDSLEKHGGLDAAAFEKLAGLRRRRPPKSGDLSVHP